MGRNFFTALQRAIETRQDRINSRIASYAKRGRKKKRKKRPKPKEKTSKKKPYRLILAYNNKQKASLGAFKTYGEAFAKMTSLIEEAEKNVLVAKKTLTTNRITSLKTSIVLIKYREEGDPLTVRVRDEYGEFIEHESTNEKFLVVEKKDYQVEEDFWVYGFHPKYDRKDAHFIYEELIRPIALSKHDFVNIKLYKNKLIFLSNEKQDLVIAKTKSDAIRLYNALQSLLEKDKSKHAILYGDCNSTSVARKAVIDEIGELTHWNLKKIQRNTTKP